MIRLEARGLGKRYGHDYVFRNLHLSLQSGQSMSVTGPNGSGKSTLLRMVCGLLRPSEGSVSLTIDGRTYDDEDRPLATGYIAPELHFYRTLTAAENLAFLLQLRRVDRVKETVALALEGVGLGRRGNDPVASFSSGMVQRLRVAAATMHKPRVLLLDEPFSNLDVEGVGMVRRTIDRHIESGGLLMLATNNAGEATLCQSDICVIDFPG